MSSDKSVEVVGCDASIMRNVWEIREREYDQKMKMEDERITKSALPSINQDWANRLLSRQPNYKRSERKAKPVEPQVDEANVWKSKRPQTQPPAPPPKSRGLGSGPSVRPGIQSRSGPASVKDKKMVDKTAHKFQLLEFITRTQPSQMVWGKAWKYNKDVPPPPEGTEVVTDWGQCWMFATQQPFSEAGKPWPNGPSKMDPQSLHLWSRPGHRMVESQELDLNLCNEDWKMSWKNPEKDNKDKGSAHGEKGFFTSLVETQQHNETLCSSEWRDSWQSTKPSDQGHQSAGPDHEANANAHDSCEMMSSEWDECWKLDNHYGSGNTRAPQGRKFKAPQWAGSWRATTMVSEDHNKSNASMKVDRPKIGYNHKPQDKFILVPCERKSRIMDLEFHDEFKASSEWSKSWQVSKTSSKPSEEIEKVLKAPPPKTDTPMTVEEKPKVNYSASADTSSDFTKLRREVIFRPKREITHSMLLCLKHLEKVSSGSEWRDSWKMLKHRMRMERKRMRPEPSKPFRESEEEPIKAAEWKNSWKFTGSPLGQKEESWQQPWLNARPARVDRVMASNHFAPVNIQRNGPMQEQSWTESWRFSRCQHRSEPEKNTGQRGCGTTSKREPERRQMEHQEPTGYRRSVGVWQESWMFSETENRPDSTSNPNQWSEAWRFSVFHTEQVNENKWTHELMEIRPQRENISLSRAQAKMSRSFDDQMFRERYPEKQWSSSWKSGPLLGQNLVSGGQKGCVSPISNECGCMWGRSFRLANPMPKVEQKWVGTPPSPCYYEVMWSRCNKVHDNINTNFTSNSRIFKLWETSSMFLQSFLPKLKNVGGSKGSTDPCEIIAKKIQLKKHLYLTIEKENQARSAQSDKKWAGCHSLGKTQPRPKRGPTSTKKVKMEEETNDMMREQWVESWRFVVRPQMLKNQMKSLVGWTESWRFLIPPYQVLNGPKSK